MQAESKVSDANVKFYSVYNLGNGFQYRIAKKNKLFSYRDHGGYDSALKNTLIARNSLLIDTLPRGMGVNLFNDDTFSMSKKKHYYQSSVRTLLDRKVYYITIPTSKYSEADARKELKTAYKKWYLMHNSIAEQYNKSVSERFNSELVVEAETVIPTVTIRKFQPELWRNVALSIFPNLASEHIISDDINDYLQNKKTNKSSKSVTRKNKELNAAKFKNLPFFSVMLQEQCSNSSYFDFKKFEGGSEVKVSRFSVDFNDGLKELSLTNSSFTRAFRWMIEKNGSHNDILFMHYEGGILFDGLPNVKLDTIDAINLMIEALASVIYKINQDKSHNVKSDLKNYDLSVMSECREAAIYVSLVGLFKSMNIKGIANDFERDFDESVTVEGNKIQVLGVDDFELPVYPYESKLYTDLKKAIAYTLNVADIPQSVLDRERLRKEGADKVTFSLSYSSFAHNSESESELRALNLAGLDKSIKVSKDYDLTRRDYENILSNVDLEESTVNASINLDPDDSRFLEVKLFVGDDINGLPLFINETSMFVDGLVSLEKQAYNFALANSAKSHHEKIKKTNNAKGFNYRSYPVDVFKLFMRKIGRQVSDVFGANIIREILTKLIQDGVVEEFSGFFKVCGYDNAVFKKDALGASLATLYALKEQKEYLEDDYLKIQGCFKGEAVGFSEDAEYEILTDKIFNARKANYPAASRKFIIDSFPDEMSLPLCSHCHEEPNVSVSHISSMNYVNIYCSNDCMHPNTGSSLFRKDLFKPVIGWIKDNIEAVHLDEVREFGISSLYLSDGEDAVQFMLDDTYKLLSDINRLIDLKDILNKKSSVEYSYYLRTPFIKSNIMNSIELCNMYRDLFKW